MSSTSFRTGASDPPFSSARHGGKGNEFVHRKPFRDAFCNRRRSMLKGGIVDELLSIRRAHGHVAAVVGTCTQLGLKRILHRQTSRVRDLAAIVARVPGPESKLARALSPETATSSLGTVSARSAATRCCSIGCWRGGSRRATDTSGSVRCFWGSAAPWPRQPGRGQEADRPAVRRRRLSGGGILRQHPSTVGAQVRKIQERFGIEHVVGDRGMISRIRENPAGLDWISALKTVRKLLPDVGEVPPHQLIPVAEILSPDFPRERRLPESARGSCPQARGARHGENPDRCRRSAKKLARPRRDQSPDRPGRKPGPETHHRHQQRCRLVAQPDEDRC